MYKNESRDNYEIRVFVHVLAPSGLGVTIDSASAFEVKCKFEFLLKPGDALEEVEEISIALTSAGTYSSNAHPVRITTNSEQQRHSRKKKFKENHNFFANL